MRRCISVSFLVTCVQARQDEAAGLRLSERAGLEWRPGGVLLVVLHGSGAAGRLASREKRVAEDEAAGNALKVLSTNAGAGAAAKGEARGREGDEEPSNEAFWSGAGWRVANVMSWRCRA